MKIPRLLKFEIIKKIQDVDHKVIVLYGARQVGKTTLIEDVIAELPYKTLRIDGEEKTYHEVLSSRDLTKLKDLIGGYELLFVDEAQKIPEISSSVKLIHDHLKDIRVILTGSSSLSLADRLAEPLTGRKWTYTLYPISFSELAPASTPFELERSLEERLIWGSYPEVFKLTGREVKKQFLSRLAGDYLYRDILELASVKHPHKIYQLLKLLAFQIGSLVSVSELANQLGMSKETVERYIDLLEKSFVLFRLGGFSRNLRKEITKNDKIYFYDVGVRNSIIDNLNDLQSRNDQGVLWENLLIAERMKRNAYKLESPSSYFWRTYTGAEIDYIEEGAGKLHGFEFKFSDKKVKVPPSWKQTYPDADFISLNRENFIPFIT